MLLQTPEFIEILKKDTDFMQSLEKEQCYKKQNSAGDKSSGVSEEEDSFNNKLVLTNLGRSKIFFIFSILHSTFSIIIFNIRYYCLISSSTIKTHSARSNVF
jgi:hypothetical protein